MYKSMKLCPSLAAAASIRRRNSCSRNACAGSADIDSGHSFARNSGRSRNSVKKVRISSASPISGASSACCIRCANWYRCSHTILAFVPISPSKSLRISTVAACTASHRSALAILFARGRKRATFFLSSVLSVSLSFPRMQRAPGFQLLRLTAQYPSPYSCLQRKSRTPSFAV